MSAEAVVGGSFASAIIKAAVDTKCSYFVDKYKEHKDTQKMLDSLEASLPGILSVIQLTKQKVDLQDESLVAWLRQLKDVTYEVEDVMDDFKVKQIQKSMNNKGKVSKIATTSARAVKSLFLSNTLEKKLNNVLEKIKNICDGIGDLIKLIKSRNNNASDCLISSSIGETSSFLPKTNKIFGREKEIELILDIIIGYPDFQYDISNYGYELGEDVVTERQDRSEIIREHDDPQKSVEDPGFVSDESSHDYPFPVSEETIMSVPDVRKGLLVVKNVM